MTRSELDRRGIGFSEYFSAGIPFSSFFQTAAISRVITVIPARAVIEREQKRRLIALGRNHPGGRERGGCAALPRKSFVKGPPLSHNSRSKLRTFEPQLPPKSRQPGLHPRHRFWKHRFEWPRRLCLAVNEIAFRELPSSSVFSNE